MRHSRQRELILELVRSRALNHPTAQDVHDAVRDHMPMVSLGTVYRNLHQLVEQGEIVAVQADGPLHYDWNREAHHHLHCSGCGSLVDLPLELEETVRERARALGHSADAVDIHVRGTCCRCLGNRNSSH